MEKLVNFVKNYRSTNPTGWRKWVFGSLAALAALLVVGVFAVRGTLRAKELARLKSEADRARERAQKAITDSEVATNLLERDRALERAARATAVATKYEKQADDIQQVHETNAALIQSLRTWEDIDAKVR